MSVLGPREYRSPDEEGGSREKIVIGVRGIERPDLVSTELAILRVPISRQAKREVAREDTCGY